METKWIVLLSILATGAPWGIVFACQNPEIFGEFTILAIADVFVALFFWLCFLLILMAAGWGFAVYYGVRYYLRTRNRRQQLA